MSRGLDNYKSAFDFIKNQLMVYDYTDEEHLHVIKLKLWVLDGKISDEEIADGIEDTDVKNPLNHYDSLMNEFVFVDRYIRTRDKKLEDGEERYTALVTSRKQQAREFVRQKKEDKTKFQDWEQEYSARPTLMTTEEVSELYDLYKIKEESGEISSIKELYEKVSIDNINEQISMQEDTIDSAKSPEEMYDELYDAAVIESARQDETYVKEMIIAHEEMVEIILSNIPPFPTPPESDLPNPDYTGPGAVDGEGNPISETTPNPVSWSNMTRVILNMPTKRLYVGQSADHESHKGMIIDELGVGGYRFVRRQEDASSPFLSGIMLSVPGEMTGAVEWDPDKWFWGFYYVEANSEAGTSNEHLVPLNCDITNLPADKQSRYQELTSRWKNQNQLREDEIANTGTRVKLESMFSAEIPDMRPDYKAHLEDKKDQKELTISIIKDRCLFGEYI